MKNTSVTNILKKLKERVGGKVQGLQNLLLALIPLFISFGSLAQTVDQRAENLQNGTQNIFMSADGSYYKHNSGSDNDPYGYGYWVTAHTLETLADAYQRTRNNVYRDRMKAILAGIRKYNRYAAGTYRNDYYDDLEWLCLAAFNCYNATKDPEYLDAVHQIWAEIKTGYTNGAMSWKKGCTTPCKNSIANSPAIVIAVKLYKLEGDPANLQMAKDLHAWMKANVLNANGGIWDAPDNHNEGWQFSYNSGMYITACLELAVVTGQQSYINDGIFASEFMMNFRLYNGGVFYLNEKGQGDGGLFKGIFAKSFIDFVRIGNLTTEQKQRYLKVIQYTGDYAWANSVNKSNNLISYDWGALPNGTIDLSTQSSGLHLFESVASLNKVHVYKDINYAGFYSQLPLGNYTMAQLQARAVADNDITSMTIPLGYSVTVFENDNFTGASKVFTANTGWMADWNDRVSSLRITDNRTFIVNAYQDINYGGYTGGLDLGNYTLAQLQSRGILDNDITSFKITPGFKVVAYDGDNFTGTATEYTADVNWLADMNDKISSLKVIDIRQYSTTVFQDVNFGGYSAGFNVGDYTLAQLQAKGVFNNDITSLKVMPGFKIIAYDGDNFTGTSVEYTADNGWLADWNDRITSMQVRAIVTNGTGDGLTGNYFNGMNFETPRLSRKDATINTDWGTGSPDASVNIDQFSVKWTGQVQPRYSGEYTFFTTTDDGERLWVNNQLIIDQWSNDGGTEYSGKITLTAGQKYDIRLEYFENGGGAKAKFEWSSASQVREVVPQSQLYSNALPTVSISSPANNASFTAPASINITANASDNINVAKVEFYNGATKLGEDVTTPYSFAWTGVAVGSYAITARATDNLGGIAVSSITNVTVTTVVGNNPPTISLTAPTNNQTYNAPASVTISANAADGDGTISKVEFYNGATKIGDDASAPYSFVWANVAAGTYTITAKATDDKGASTTSTAVSITVKSVVTNLPPTITLTAPTNNQSYNAPASVTISANAADADGTISKVEFYNGTTKVGEDLTTPYSFVWANVAAGTYAITAKVTDDKGAATTSTAASITVKTVVTNVPPTITLTAPTNNQSYNAPASVTISANAADADGTISKVEFYNGATKVGEDLTTPYSFVWANVAAGTYSITAKATDNGGAAITSTAVTVTVIAPNVPPTITLTAPTNNQAYNAPASVTISANAADADGTVSKVEFYNGATKVGEDASSPYSFVWTNVAAGTYTISAKSIDNKNASTNSSSVSIKVNTVVTDACANVAQYAENNGYVAGSAVKNAGRRYECKEWPYSGWCNGAGWAYAPGTGAYWQDAWYDRGSCTARLADDATTSVLSESTIISPNPVQDELTIVAPFEISTATFTIVDMQGHTVHQSTASDAINTSALESGIYTLILITSDNQKVTKRFVKMK